MSGHVLLGDDPLGRLRCLETPTNAMKKPREQMTFEIDLPLLARLEVISRKLRIPMDVLIVWGHVRYGEKMCPDLAWPRESKD